MIRRIERRPVVIVDLPGTGGSPVSWFWPRMPRYARMLMAVMDHLNFSGRFSVAGVSWGGILAQQIARSSRGRVTHLILMATSPGILMVPGKTGALLRMLTPQRYISRDYMVRNAATLYGGEMRNQPQLAREHAGVTRAPDTLAYLQQVMAAYQFTSLHWLHRVACPALVISGDDDPLVRPINARILAACLPNAQLKIVEGGGHLFMTLRATETAALINRFISA